MFTLFVFPLVKYKMRSVSKDTSPQYIFLNTRLVNGWVFLYYLFVMWQIIRFWVIMLKNVLGELLRMIIYFSKINLVTTDLFDIYEDSTVLNRVKNSILSYVRSGVSYKVEDNTFDENGQIHQTSTYYKLSIGMKREDTIAGVIYKETRLFYKKVNDSTNEIESHTIPTIEDIKFYYDVEREIVGFHTRNRFGYKEFNTAFSELINLCMKENDLELRFEANLYNEGMGIEEIESELKD